MKQRNATAINTPLVGLPVESSYTTSYQWLILYNLPPILHRSKLWLIIGQIFRSERGVAHFNALAGVIPWQYHSWKLDSLAYISAAENIGVSSTTFT